MNDNANLESIYSELKAITGVDEVLQSKMSPPLLLMPQRKWFSSRERILVVGQETLGWKKTNIQSFEDYAKTPDAIDTLQNAYVDFCFAENKARHKNSPFWRAYRQVRKAFDTSIEGIDTNVLWTNLYKVSNNGKSWYRKNNYQDRKSVEKALKSFLRREIDILNPTGIIFFTGPRYDKYLVESFDGKVEYSPVDDIHPVRQISKLDIDYLRVPVYRTYHPNYLQRAKKNCYIEIIVRGLQQN